MCRFKLLQLVYEAVEFRIADLRIVEHVIAVLVMPDILAQRFDFRFGVFGCSSHKKQFTAEHAKAAEKVFFLDFSLRTLRSQRLMLLFMLLACPRTTAIADRR